MRPCTAREILGCSRCKTEGVRTRLAVAASRRADQRCIDAPAQTPFVCSADDAIGAPPSELPRYTLSVRIDKGLREGHGRLHVRIRTEQATDRLVFRLWANQPFRTERLAADDHRSAGRRAPNRRDAAESGRPLPFASRSPRDRTSDVDVLATTVSRGDLNARLYGGEGEARLATFFPLLAWDPRSGWQTDPPSAIGWETWTSPSANFA